MFSVCTTWGVLCRQYYLLDVFRKKLNYPELKRSVIELAKRYSACTIVIEDKASGTQLIQDLKSDCIIGITEYKPPVPIGNSNSNILMVQAAQHREWEHASHRPHRARDRRILLQR